MDSKNSYISTVRDALSEDSNDDASTTSNVARSTAAASSSQTHESSENKAMKRAKPSYKLHRLAKPTSNVARSTAAASSSQTHKSSENKAMKRAKPSYKLNRLAKPTSNVARSTAAASSSQTHKSSENKAMKRAKDLRNVFTFSNVHGRQISLSNSNTVATRTVRFCNSLVFANQQLKRGYTFRFRIEKMVKKIGNAIAVGAIASVKNLTLPLTAFGLKHHSWIITNDCKKIYGKIVYTRDADFLKNIEESSIVSLHFHYNGSLVLVLDNKYWCNVAKISKKYRGIYPTVGLFGKASKISIIPPQEGVPDNFKLDTIVECSDEDKAD